MTADELKAFRLVLTKESGIGSALTDAATTAGSHILGTGTRLLSKASPAAAGKVMDFANKVGPQRLSKYVGGAAIGAGVAGGIGAGGLGISSKYRR